MPLGLLIEAQAVHGHPSEYDKYPVASAVRQIAASSRLKPVYDLCEAQWIVKTFLDDVAQRWRFHSGARALNQALQQG